FGGYYRLEKFFSQTEFGKLVVVWYSDAACTTTFAQSSPATNESAGAPGDWVLLSGVAIAPANAHSAFFTISTRTTGSGGSAAGHARAGRRGEEHLDRLSRRGEEPAALDGGSLLHDSPIGLKLVSHLPTEAGTDVEHLREHQSPVARHPEFAGRSPDDEDQE